MTTINGSTKAPVSALQAVFNAASALSKGENILANAIRQGGNDATAIRNMACAGRLSISLKITQEKALQLLNKTGNPKHKPDVSDDVRSINEEKAYGAARVWYTGFLKRHGLSTSSSQGGDRTETKDVMDTEKLVIPGKPKVESAIDLATYMLASAKSQYDFFLLNKTHKAVVSDVGSELMGAAADYLDLVRSIVASHTKHV